MVSVGGCNLFGPRSTPRPAPTRPISSPRPSAKSTRTPIRPAPTKNLPGVGATSTANLQNTIAKIKTAVAKNDWPTAMSETNKLGAAWTRFKPSSKGTMSATEMKNFDTNYAKLQKDIRAKNKSGADRDLRALKDSVAKMRT